MASFIAYFMSISCVLLGVLFLAATVKEVDKMTPSRVRLALLAFVGFGFLGWAFAYAGGI